MGGAREGRGQSWTLFVFFVTHAPLSPFVPPLTPRDCLTLGGEGGKGYREREGGGGSGGEEGVKGVRWEEDADGGFFY